MEQMVNFMEKWWLTGSIFLLGILVIILLWKSYNQIKKLNGNLRKITLGVEKYIDAILVEEELTNEGEMTLKNTKNITKEIEKNAEDEAIFNSVLREFFS